jgi:CECR6/TMEM121 family
MLLKVIYFMLVNAPIFVIRMLIWHLEDQNISVFLMKNIIALGLAVKDIHEFSQEVAEVVRDEFHLPSCEFRDFYPEPVVTFNLQKQLEGAADAGESVVAKATDASEDDSSGTEQ